MPRLSEATKDVVSCEKLRGSAHSDMIRRCPNGETPLAGGQGPARGQTRGTETSKYPEEEKTTVIPRVVASEMGRAQT